MKTAFFWNKLVEIHLNECLKFLKIFEITYKKLNEPESGEGLPESCSSRPC